MHAADVVVLVVAIALVPLGGALAALDAALNRVSAARVSELERERRAGAAALARIMLDRPRYTNLLLLLRVACELTATVLVTTGAAFVPIVIIAMFLYPPLRRRGGIAAHVAISGAG